MRFASPASRGFERFSLVASCSLFSLVSSRHKKTSEARVHCMASRLALFCPKSAHFACFYKYIRFMCCELLIKQLAGCKGSFLADQFDLQVYEVIVRLCGRYSFLSARKVRGLGARGRSNACNNSIVLCVF